MHEQKILLTEEQESILYKKEEMEELYTEDKENRDKLQDYILNLKNSFIINERKRVTREVPCVYLGREGREG